MSRNRRASKPKQAALSSRLMSSKTPCVLPNSLASEEVPLWKQVLRASETAVFLCFYVAALSLSDKTLMGALLAAAAVVACASFLADPRLAKGYQYTFSVMACLICATTFFFVLWKNSPNSNAFITATITNMFPGQFINADLKNVGSAPAFALASAGEMFVSDEQPSKEMLDPHYNKMLSSLKLRYKDSDEETQPNADIIISFFFPKDYRDNLQAIADNKKWVYFVGLVRYKSNEDGKWLDLSICGIVYAQGLPHICPYRNNTKVEK